MSLPPAPPAGRRSRCPPDQGARRRPSRLTVDPATAIQLASAARASYPSIVAAAAIAIAGSAASGTWLRLKSRPAPHCSQAFYDDLGLIRRQALFKARALTGSRSAAAGTVAVSQASAACDPVRCHRVLPDGR